MNVDILGHTLEMKKGLDADGFDVRMEEWKETRRTLRVWFGDENMTNHQGNTKQNHNEVSPLTC